MDEPESLHNDAKLNNLRIYYDLALEQMRRQHESLGRVQTKLGTILGFGFVLVGLVFNVMITLPVPEHSLLQFLPALTLVILLFALAWLLVGYRVAPYSNAPNIESIKWHKNQGDGMSGMLNDAIDGMASSFAKVEDAMEKLKKRINLSAGLLLVGSFLMTIQILHWVYVH